MPSTSRVAKALAVTSAFLGFTAAQSQPAYQTRNLTPDGFWHNRYHALLSMAAYGEYDDTCPVQTFTEAAKLKNFPESTRVPWLVTETWDTPSGCKGFGAVIPEMNKVLLIFRGNYDMEQNLPLEVSSWDELGEGIGATCYNCTVNSYALQGYLEAKEATNNFALTRQAYEGQGLVFSIAGHGLGGMHSLIASADFNYQQICYYSHTYGAPRTFNQRGALWYNARFNGEAGERGVFNNDQYTEFIPATADYAHSGTTFYYWGVNATNSPQPNWTICWPDEVEANGGVMLDACVPQPQAGAGTALQDHYFYFTPVSECGRPSLYNTEVVDDFLEFHSDPANADEPYDYTGTATATTTYYQRPTSTGRSRTTVQWSPSTTDHYYSSSSSSTRRYSSSSSTSYRSQPSGPAGNGGPGSPPS